MSILPSRLNIRAPMNQDSSRGRHSYRTSKRRRRIFWIAFIPLLLAALLASRPAYHWLKAKRAASLAAKAEEFVQQNNFLEAANTYRAALQLDPLGYQPLQGAAKVRGRSARARTRHKVTAADACEAFVRRDPHEPVARLGALHGLAPLQVRMRDRDRARALWAPPRQGRARL